MVTTTKALQNWSCTEWRNICIGIINREFDFMSVTRIQTIFLSILIKVLIHSAQTSELLYITNSSNRTFTQNCDAEIHLKASTCHNCLHDSRMNMDIKRIWISAFFLIESLIRKVNMNTTKLNTFFIDFLKL